MRIILFGKNGQVGWELQRALAPLGELISLDRNGKGALCGDLSNLQGIAQTIQTVKPDVVVNAAAYTAVDKAEDELDLASLVNAKATEVLARESALIDAWLVHYSTDYVFDGSGKKPWQESDSVAPLNFYGKSKLAGDLAVQASGCKYLLFRTSWVYNVFGNNFAKTIIRLSEERDELRIIDDQIGVPTGADLLADITAHTLREAFKNSNLSGLYHIAPHGETSWYGYANYIIAYAKNLGKQLPVKEIVPIPSSAYITPALRPKNSRLDTTKLLNTFSLYLPHWEMGVTRMLKQILG